MAYAEKAFLDLIYIRVKKGIAPLFTEKIYLEILQKKRLKEFKNKYPQWVTKAMNQL